MPDSDSQLQVGVLVDVSGVATGTAEVSTAVDEMAARVKAAFGSIEKAPEGVQNALRVMANASTQSSAIVTDSAAAIEEALRNVEVQSVRTGTSMERAMALGAGRIAAAELGVGMLGSSLARVGAASSTLGPILAAAFPAFAAFALISIIDTIADKITEMRDRAVDAALAWDKVDHSIITFDDHLTKSLERANSEIDRVTRGPLAAFDDKIKEAVVDTDVLFQHISSVLSEFESESKKNSRGILMQFITGEGGVDDVISEAKRAQNEIEQSLNKGERLRRRGRHVQSARRGDSTRARTEGTQKRCSGTSGRQAAGAASQFRQRDRRIRKAASDSSSLQRGYSEVG